jgi:hypothetical protein
MDMQENKKIKNFSFKAFLKPNYILIFIIFIVILVLFLTVHFEIRNMSIQFSKYISSISTFTNKVLILNKDFDEQMAKLNGSELLLSNMNRILSTVYYGTADNDILEEAKDFTAFTIMYKKKYFLITAGHCIEFKGEHYKNFKFKANNTTDWINLNLVDYKSDYENNIDYAIFYFPNRIRTGLIPATPEEELTPQYVLGNLERGLNIVKRYKDAKKGESGSPILNSKCHVIGIMIKKDGTYTPIQVVLEALDTIKIE